MSGQTTKLGYSNALWNIAEPLYVTVEGSVEYVAIEVLVGQLVRTLMGMKRHWIESAEIHSFSLPMLGPLNIGAPLGDFAGKDDKVKYADEITEGAKGVPGVIAGYIAREFLHNGLRIPGFANKDFLALIVGKILSRPVTQAIFSMLPNTAQGSLKVLQALFNRATLVRELSERQRKDA